MCVALIGGKSLGLKEREGFAIGKPVQWIKSLFQGIKDLLTGAIILGLGD